MVRYKPLSIRETGLAAHIDARSSEHPLNWGYREYKWLRGQGLNNTDIARAMNIRALNTIKEWNNIDDELTAIAKV